MSKIRNVAGILGLILMATGITGGFVAQVHIVRIKKALVVVDMCKLEQLEANDKIGGAACAVLVDAESRFGQDMNAIAKELAGFYDSNKDYVSGGKK